MTELYLIIPLAAGAFFATNMDNLFVLAAMLARDPRHRNLVLFGYAASVLIVLALSFLIAKSADLIPIEYLGLLGVVPLAMGTRGLIDLIRHRDKLEKKTESRPATQRSVPHQTALTLISNSTDTLIVLSALLADTKPAADPVVLLSCLVAAGVIAATAAYALNHRRFEKAVEKIAPVLTPLILIVVGVYVLANTATDLVPG